MSRIERVATDQPVRPELPDVPEPAARRAVGRQAVVLGSPGSSGASPSTRPSISAIEKPVSSMSKLEVARQAAPSAPRRGSPRPSRRSARACCRRGHRPASRPRVIVSMREQGTVAKPRSLAASTRPWPARIMSPLVDQHRVGEAEAADAVGDLPDLLLRMRPGVPWVQAGATRDTGSRSCRTSRESPPSGSARIVPRLFEFVRS